MSDPYYIDDPSSILSPSLVIFHELVEENLAMMLKMTSGPDRLRPHCKTHKMPAIIEKQLSAGITKHKCATIAEAEMLAECGVPDVLLAYPMVGPNQRRIGELARTFSKTSFSVIADDKEAVLSLDRAIAGLDQSIDVLLDVDSGQGRTGIPVGEEARTVYEAIDAAVALNCGGFHIYDGHNKDSDQAIRGAAIHKQMVPIMDFRRSLEAQGLAVPKLVCGGTPSFPIYAKMDDQSIECSPGTCIFHDHGYLTKFPDLEFTPAAMILTRVISCPSKDRFCLDLGYKAVASDPPGDRVFLPGFPNAKYLLQNEEHLLVDIPDARLRPGDSLLARPMHICPTCYLHSHATVLEGGKPLTVWEVRARVRMLTV